MKTAKKTISILLSVLLTLAVFPMAFVPAFADPEPDPEPAFVWAYDETTDTLTVSGTGAIPAGSLTMEDIEEEETIAAYIASYPHPEYMNAKHVVLSEGVTGVGEMTFFLFKMETLSLPSTLESIDNAAFLYCCYLEEVEFPASLKSIGVYAFMGCTMLQEIALPEGVETVGLYAFGACYLNELHIPSTLQVSGEAADLRSYFSTEFLTDLYNASETAVLRSDVYNLGSAEAARNMSLRMGLMMVAELLSITNGFADEDPTPAQIEAGLAVFADFAAYVNAKLGTSYTVETLEDMQAMMEDLYPRMDGLSGVPAYFTVYCTETGAQHAACADAGFRHKLFGHDEYCLNETVFSGSAGGITWVVDPDAGTLTLGGSGTFAYPDGAPWKKASSYFNTVVFAADFGVTSFDFDWESDPFAGCNLQQLTLPASLTSISENALSLLADRLTAFAVAEGNTVFYAEDGALYQYLTAAKRAELLNASLDPGAADLMLLRVPRAADHITISNRTAILLPSAVYYNRSVTSLTVPDSVLSIENDAIRSNECLTSVHIGAGVKLLRGRSICLRAYRQTAPAITVSEQNPWLTADGGCIYSENGGNLILLVDPENMEELTLGAEVSSHEEGVFSYAYGLKKLTILNPAFDLNSSGLRTDTVVYGYEGSPAQRYCETFGVRFIIIETDEIESIEILTPPTVTVYTVGDTLCLDGLQLTVNFAGGGSAVRVSGYEVSDCDMSAAGEKTVTVAYGGKTAQFTVTVGDTAPVYEIHVGESLNLLLLPQNEGSYDYAADVKFVCEEDGAPFPKLSNYLPGASWYLQLFDENMEKIADLYDWNDDYVFEAGKTYYFHCVIYVDRTEANHAATLTLYAPHDHTADTYTKVTNPPTCYSLGAEGTYCAVCGKYLGGRTLQTLPHDLDENGYCTICGKLFRYTIGDGEAKSFITKEYNGDPLIGVYTAAEAKTVTVTVMQNDNYGGPFVKRNGENGYNYTWDNEMNAATFTVDVQPGDVLEIGVYPAWREDTVVVAVDHTHNFVQQGETLDPTCTSYGYVPYQCDGCGVTFKRTLYMLPHTPDGEYEEDLVEPNCGLERDGHHTLRCAVCGNTYYDAIYWEHTDADRDGVCDACGHTIGVWMDLNVPVEFTPDSNGYYDYLFTAPADGDYLFTMRTGDTLGGGYYLAVSNLGNYWGGGERVDAGTMKVSMTQGESRRFQVGLYWASPYTLEIKDVHQPEAVEETPAACTEDGNIAHWQCAVCGKLFADEACETELTADDVAIPAGHAMEARGENAATCTEDGNVACWYCTRCEKYFADEAGETELDYDTQVVIPAGHAMEAHGENDATCASDGNIAYWYCTRCEKYFADENGENEIGLADTVIPGGHVMTAHPGAQATCEADGNLPYYECTRCGNWYIDGAGENLIENHNEVILPARHTLTQVAAKDPGCETAGNVAYWKCSECRKCFRDENGANEIAEADTVLPARHTLTHVAGKPATCKEAGNVEYWTCTLCGKTFSDANGANRITDTVLPKTENHVWNGGTVTQPATCTAVGKKTFTCTVCGKTRTEDIGKVSHRDDNGDGLCDYGCGTQMGGGQQEQPGGQEQPSGEKCPLCGESHTGFFGKIVGFFHRIIYFFKNLFKR